MAQGPSGHYRTLSERLEAEEFAAGQYEVVPVVDTEGVVDMASVYPGAITPVGFRIDTLDNVFLRGALAVDFDEVDGAGGIDWSGTVVQPGTVSLFTLPERARPTDNSPRGFPITVAVQVGDATWNLASFLTVNSSGLVACGLGGCVPGTSDSLADALAGGSLSVILSGDYSLN